MSIRILLADDSEFVRNAIISLLKQEPSIDLVGEAGTFCDVLSMATTLRPDVVLIDLHMKDDPRDGGSAMGAELIQYARQIIAISFAPDDAAKKLSTTLGCWALLDKASLSHSLIPTILESMGLNTLSRPAIA